MPSSDGQKQFGGQSLVELGAIDLDVLMRTFGSGVERLLAERSLLRGF